MKTDNREKKAIEILKLLEGLKQSEAISILKYVNQSLSYNSVVKISE